MTEQNPMPPDDRELEQFLARRSELSRLHRAAAESEGAPNELDAPVLARAREELRRLPPRKQRWQHWTRPLALAASLVVVLSVAWLMPQETLPRTARVEYLPAPAALPPARSASPAAPMPAPPAAAERTEALQAAQAAEQARASHQEQELSMSAQRQQKLAERKAYQPLPDVARLRAKPESVPPPVPVDNAAAAPPAPPPPPPAPPAQISLDIAAPAASLAPAAPVAAPAMAMPAPAPAMKAAVSADPCASLPGASAAEHQRDIDSAAWLERIRRLRDVPDMEAAHRELACYSYLHPADQVPDDLKSLLKGRP